MVVNENPNIDKSPVTVTPITTSTAMIILITMQGFMTKEKLQRVRDQKKSMNFLEILS